MRERERVSIKETKNVLKIYEEFYYTWHYVVCKCYWWTIL